MTKIILIRHGQDEDNYNKILNGHRDTKLTDLGREQARVVAEKLKDDNVEIILTATIISNELKISEVHTEELLKERNFGVLTGKPLSDIPKLAKEVLLINDVNYFVKSDGAEDFPALYKRAQSFLNKISKEYPNKVIVAVTHGDIGKMIRAVYHNLTWDEGLRTPSFENTGVLHLGDKDKLE